MSVDVQRFMDLLPYLNMLWSSPLQMVLCSYFIGQEMGVVPTVVGVSIMIIAIPLNGVAAGFSRRYQLAQMKSKDQRVKLMNEILGGVKVLKLYGWEPSFIKQVRMYLFFTFSKLFSWSDYRLFSKQLEKYLYCDLKNIFQNAFRF